MEFFLGTTQFTAMLPNASLRVYGSEKSTIFQILAQTRKPLFFLALPSPQSSLTRLLSPIELVCVTYDKYFAGEFCCQL